MAVAAASPAALAVACPTCRQLALSRCIGPAGRQVPTHAARKRAAGCAAVQEEVKTGG